MDEFGARVWDAVRRIPRGRVTTYGAVAAAAGHPRAARAVGRLLHTNPEPYVIPCHRIVNAQGRLAPAYAFGGLEVQRALLESECVAVRDDGSVDLAVYGCVPDTVAGRTDTKP